VFPGVYYGESNNNIVVNITPSNDTIDIDVAFVAIDNLYGVTVLYSNSTFVFLFESSSSSYGNNSFTYRLEGFTICSHNSCLSDNNTTLLEDNDHDDDNNNNNNNNNGNQDIELVTTKLATNESSSSSSSASASIIIDGVTSVIISNCSFEGQLLGVSVGSGANVTIDDSLFRRESQGSIIVANSDSGQMTVTSTTFESNVLVDDNSTSTTVITIMNSSQVLLFKNCNFLNNYGSGVGGTVFQLIEASVTVSNCQFVNNTALWNGSSIYATENSSVSISNCTFVNNTATYGGVIYVEGSNLTIDSATFEDNQVSEYRMEFSNTIVANSCLLVLVLI